MGASKEEGGLKGGGRGFIWGKIKFGQHQLWPTSLSLPPVGAWTLPGFATSLLERRPLRGSQVGKVGDASISE